MSPSGLDTHSLTLVFCPPVWTRAFLCWLAAVHHCLISDLNPAPFNHAPTGGTITRAFTESVSQSPWWGPSLTANAKRNAGVCPPLSCRTPSTHAHTRKRTTVYSALSTPTPHPGLVIFPVGAQAKPADDASHSLALPRPQGLLCSTSVCIN